jgi:hypothetical protein
MTKLGMSFFYIKQTPNTWLGDLGTSKKNNFYFDLGEICAILYF